ncbi:Protein of unknown function [Chryseolinea serpens]|uniref:DUF1223 domain-containing protein n=1 Tax=Chryseolinea serpens TaxID=947013 RepID=A0A1M5UKA5_9BACT|nr:DUF1223 domain-containing protein [Chryseolinea serpens]SHH63464.1 Protein of unknown function [Chryseolinea serpens]
MKYGVIVLFLAALNFHFAPRKVYVSEPVAVVELFTAEGCSSCPAADELLDEMTSIMQKEGKRVISLAYHVTYWNHLGWIDPYSVEAYTDRQKLYQKTLKLPMLYTPQAVVNGKYEFVGSNPVFFRYLVQAALDSVPARSLEAIATKSDSVVTVQYSLSKLPKNSVLNVAVIEERVEHSVLRGENKDKVLKHFHVVRSMKQHEAKEKDEINLVWPRGLGENKGSIILYLQNAKTLRIISAAEIKLKAS